MYENKPQLNAVLKALEDIQASDITVIDVSQQTTITDVMVICSGRSSRHVKAIAEQVMGHLKAANMPPLSDHGLQGGDWALVDFGDVILHIMQPDSRSFYNLEGLWQHGA